MAYSANIRVVEDNIISLLKNKDQRGMEMLYDKYGNVIYGFIYNILKSDEQSEECFYEVFIRVWHSIDFFDPSQQRLFTWVINMARQSAVKKSQDSTFVKNSRVKGDNLFLETAYNPEAVGTVDLVKQLDKRQLKVIEEIYFEGKDYKELSEQVDIPAANLKSMVRSVLRMIQITPLVTAK